MANGGISADGKTYIFHLRQGVKFAAPVSREVTAQDFKYSFQRMLRESEAPTFFYTGVVGAQDYIDKKVNDVKGFQATDKYTVKITLSAPDPTFLYEMTMPFTSVVPKEWVAKEGKSFIRNPLGTGPFVFDHWTAGQEIVAKRNPDYWQKGRPYLDEIDFSFTADPTHAGPEGGARRDRRDGRHHPGRRLPAHQERPYVGQVRRRRAADRLVLRVHEHAGEAVRQPAGAPGRQLRHQHRQDREDPRRPGHWRSTRSTRRACPATTRRRPSTPTTRPRPSSCWPPPATRTASRPTFYSHNVDPFPKLAQAIQEDLQQVGITVDIKLMDRATYWDYITYKKNKVPIGLSDWYMDFPDPSDWIGPLFSAASAVDGGQNSSWWVDPKVEALYKQSTSELDPAKRIAMFQEMQKLLMNDAPIAPALPAAVERLRRAQGGRLLHPPCLDLQLHGHVEDEVTQAGRQTASSSDLAGGAARARRPSRPPPAGAGEG